MLSKWKDLPELVACRLRWSAHRGILIWSETCSKHTVKMFSVSSSDPLSARPSMIEFHDRVSSFFSANTCNDTCNASSTFPHQSQSFAWWCQLDIVSPQSCIVVSTHLEQGYQVCTSREYIGNHSSIWFYLRSLHLPEEIQTIEVSSLRGIEYAHDIELHDIKSSLGIWLYIFNGYFLRWDQIPSFCIRGGELFLVPCRF
jgi:hypothetical protein